MPNGIVTDSEDEYVDGDVPWYLVAGLSDEGRLIEPYW
jgi:hypothetical protein